MHIISKKKIYDISQNSRREKGGIKQVQTDDPQILGEEVQNWVTTMKFLPGFMHPWSTPKRWGILDTKASSFLYLLTQQRDPREIIFSFYILSRWVVL